MSWLPDNNAFGRPQRPRSPAARPIWLYTPNVALSTRSSRSLRITDSWDEILGQVRREQAGRPLRVALHPCSPLQVLGEHGSDSGIHP